MIKRILGYILAGVGFIGVVFFKRYKGDLIPLPMLWMFVSICMVGMGLYFVVLGITKKEGGRLNSAEALLKQIRGDGEI